MNDLHNSLMKSSAFYGEDKEARSKLEEETRNACLDYGFFQLRNHGIPENLQREILRQSKDFFRLPTEVKDKYNKGKHYNPQH